MGGGGFWGRGRPKARPGRLDSVDDFSPPGRPHPAGVFGTNFEVRPRPLAPAAVLVPLPGALGLCAAPRALPHPPHLPGSCVRYLLTPAALCAPPVNNRPTPHPNPPPPQSITAYHFEYGFSLFWALCFVVTVAFIIILRWGGMLEG